MRKKKSLILEAVHETAKDLYEAGVMDRVTMREFDRLCLPAILFLFGTLREQRGYANDI
jgi:putative transcriptional regulator